MVDRVGLQMHDLGNRFVDVDVGVPKSWALLRAQSNHDLRSIPYRALLANQFAPQECSKFNTGRIHQEVLTRASLTCCGGVSDVFGLGHHGPAGSQARQKPLNYRTQSLQRSRLLCRASKRPMQRSKHVDGLKRCMIKMVARCRRLGSTEVSAIKHRRVAGPITAEFYLPCFYLRQRLGDFRA
jgi:hypothetical protein